MTQKDLFDKLGAPLKNVRWSWGAVRPRDGVIFLRVWKDRVNTDGAIWVANYKRRSKSPGHRERLEHVNLIKNGARCYLIICEAVDEKEKPRRIRTFDETRVFAGGRLKEDVKDMWIELGPPRLVTEVE